MTTTLFPVDPYDGVAVFEAPVVNLAAVVATDYPLAEMPALMDATFPAIFTALEAAAADVRRPWPYTAASPPTRQISPSACPSPARSARR